MENKNYLEEYQYSNAGQYRAIMQSQGYKTEYNKGYILFSKGNEQFRIKMDDIKAHINTKKDSNQSLERICQLFDKEKSNLPEYIDELSKEGISIVNWGDIRSDNKERFTIIDHQNKICHTGKELYDYALENGFLLDGKGSKMSDNTFSQLVTHNGKTGKIRYSENGISIFYKKEKLEIPDTIFGEKLSNQQKLDLQNGKRIQLKTKGGNIYLEIDRELNSIVVLSEKELHIPQQIGGYELTNADKYLLANGYSLEDKLMHSKEGYFLADISFTPDKFGISFSNVQMIPEHKAKELILEKTKKMEYIVKLSNNIEINTIIEKLESYGIDTNLLKQDFASQMSKQTNPMYCHIKDSKVVAWEHNIDEKKYDGQIRTIEELPSLKNQVASKLETNTQPDLNNQKAVDRYIEELILKEDYSSLDQLNQKGCKPSKELLSQLNGKFSDNTVIAVKKIFHIEPARPSIPGDIKTGQPIVSKKPEMVRPISQTVNRIFSDL